MVLKLKYIKFIEHGMKKKFLLGIERMDNMKIEYYIYTIKKPTDDLKLK